MVTSARVRRSTWWWQDVDNEKCRLHRNWRGSVERHSTRSRILRQQGYGQRCRSGSGLDSRFQASTRVIRYIFTAARASVCAGAVCTLAFTRLPLPAVVLLEILMRMFLSEQSLKISESLTGGCRRSPILFLCSTKVCRPVSLRQSVIVERGDPL